MRRSRRALVVPIVAPIAGCGGGTGARVVSPPGRAYVPGVQWSPDGQWILARFAPMQGWAGTTVALLNVSSGLEIPLAWTTGYNGIGLPAWKPVP